MLGSPNHFRRVGKLKTRFKISKFCSRKITLLRSLTLKEEKWSLEIGKMLLSEPVLRQGGKE